MAACVLLHWASFEMRMIHYVLASSAAFIYGYYLQSEVSRCSAQLGCFSQAPPAVVLDRELAQLQFERLLDRVQALPSTHT